MVKEALQQADLRIADAEREPDRLHENAYDLPVEIREREAGEEQQHTYVG